MRRLDSAALELDHPPRSWPAREVIIRTGLDEAAIEAAAHVLLRCFDGNENARLGGVYARALVRSFADDRDRTFHFALSGDRVVGFATGEPADERPRRYRRLRGAACAALLRQPWLFADPAMLRMAISRWRGAVEDALPAGSWFLALIGVDDSFRRCGIGRDLLHAFENEGRRRGFASASLEVRASNVGARAMYEAAGWSPAAPPFRGRFRYERHLDQ